MTKHFLAMSLLAFAPLCVLACTQSQIAACVEGTVFHSENVNDLKEGGVIRSETREHLEKECNDYEKVKTCLKILHRECDRYVGTVLESMTDRYDYMCGDGKQKILRNLECFNEPVITIALTQCNKTFNNKMKSLLGRFDGGALEEICQAVDGVIRCHISAVRGECNNDAVSVVEELYDHSFRSLRRLINCAGSKVPPTTKDNIEMKSTTPLMEERNNTERHNASVVVWLITAVAAVTLSAAI